MFKNLSFILIVMKLYFATGNTHKLEEARAVLSDYAITVEQLDDKGHEAKEATIQDVARTAAQRLAEKHKKPVIVDDTGVFFEAYKNFPGAHPRLMFELLGYKGLMKLLGERREAYFLCCVACCMPGKKPVLFEGRLDGRIAKKPADLRKDVMPYERIFVPKGMKKTISALTRVEKNKISHRAAAFRKLGEYLA